VSFTLTAAIGATAGALGGWCYGRTVPPPPQIRVVDMRRIVEAIAADPRLDEAGRRARTQEISDAISEFVTSEAHDGALILEGAAVLRAPPSVYIEPSDSQSR
jgi:hypothetical protein